MPQKRFEHLRESSTYYQWLPSTNKNHDSRYQVETKKTLRFKLGLKGCKGTCALSKMNALFTLSIPDKSVSLSFTCNELKQPFVGIDLAFEAYVFEFQLVCASRPLSLAIASLIPFRCWQVSWLSVLIPTEHHQLPQIGFHKFNLLVHGLDSGAQLYTLIVNPNASLRVPQPILASNDTRRSYFFQRIQNIRALSRSLGLKRSVLEMRSACTLANRALNSSNVVQSHFPDSQDLHWAHYFSCSHKVPPLSPRAFSSNLVLNR